MKITNPEALMAASISRRSLVKTSAIGSLALASSAFTLPFSRIAHAASRPRIRQCGRKSGLEFMYR